MKIYKKILLIVICVFLAICHTNNIIYAYTIDEVKEYINFKTVQEDGEPEHYDVSINASDLILSEKIPYIKFSLSDVLYRTEDFFDLFDINFFNEDSSNNNDDWQNIRNIVISYFRITIYIGFATMLTLLIYISVSIVYSSISQKESILPFEQKLKNAGGNKSPQKQTRERRLIEQWIISFFVLAISPFIISLVIFGADYLVEALPDDIEEILKKDSYIVYVQNSKMANISFVSSDKSNVSSNLSEEEVNNLREAVAEQAKTQDNLEVPSGYSQMWIELVYETALNIQIDEQCCAHNAGVNSIVSTDATDMPIGAAVFSYTSDSGIIDSSCGQDKGQAGIYIGNDQIATATGEGSTGIEIISIEEWEEKWEFSGWGWLPGLDDIANGQKPINNQNTTTSKASIISYYFETNLEGLLMFQSQYDWEKDEYPSRNIANMIFGFAITVLKIFLSGLFIIRMVVIAIFIILTPIIILINGYLQIAGNKGFLKNCFIIFLYIVCLKPALQLIYYVFINSNQAHNNLAKNPVYVGFMIIAMYVFVILYIRKLFKIFKTSKQKNIVNKKV